jgi:hypothetical protein
LNSLNVKAWMQSFDSVVSAQKIAVGLVRHDLGLPPAS